MRARRPLIVAAALTLGLLLPAEATAQSPACPCTLFAPSEAPLGDALQDSPVEVGVKLRSDEDGYITALRFYKQPNNTGTHVGHLWTSSGQLLAEAEFTSETASGWQSQPLPVPVPIPRDTTYVVSYHSSQGRFAFDPGYFFAGKSNPPLHAPPDSVAGGNGVYRYGATGGFPDQTYNSTNYWVDAVFERQPPADTRAPRVSSTSPAAGAAGVPGTSDVTVTFDEPVDPATVNGATVTLSDGTNPVPAVVTYDPGTRTARLDPQANLAFGRTYTATVKGGAGGVADVVGNVLAADHSWSFSTAPACPCTVFGGDAPAGDAVSDQPVEVGMKFRSDEDGYITALRFYKQPNNTGTHVGHLWSESGQLLASATYTGETASGWQQVELPNPVAIAKDTVYITSYYAAGGRYAFSPGFFHQGVDRAPMHGLSNGVAGGNGVYRYGASGFPDQTFNATNYWVDASFDRTVPPDTRGPTITELSPASGASDVAPGVQVSATFDEPLAPASVSGATFTLRDDAGTAVPATVAYDPQARAAKLTPQSALAFSTRYTARLTGGAGGVTDVAGNPLAADRTWSFTTTAQSPAEGPGGPIQVITDPADPFGGYYAEILRGEGLNAFDVTAGPVTAAKLAGHDTLLLASAALSDAEVAALTTWVQAGGNLIAMRPDKKLAGLLGLSDSGGTRANQYLTVDTGTVAGAGIEGQSLQFHGTADRYGLAGATAVATLYSNASTPTADVGVSLRDVGSGGGQAAAFVYDLARSVVYTRQGNPAWAGQKRDGTPNGIRAVDLFYPDWVDMSKVDVPQADEQQRLLANLITEMSRDRAPLPRFWYLPRGEKAAVVLTGDDHAVNGTPAWFNRLKASSPSGCSVADWECPRGTSYLYPDTAMTNAQAASYEADGFEVALHLNTGCADFTQASLDADLTNQLAAFGAQWPDVRQPATNRTHCIVWSDWATQPKREKAHGIRFDTNYYYHGAPGWLTSPGLLTGSGLPQRFADLNGATIDVYQAMTQVTDESEMSMAPQVDTLLDNALGSRAWYGVVTVNTHTDYGDHANTNNIVASAQERGVPVISSAQMLDWLDGRNGSSFGGIAYDDGTLSFTIDANTKARGLQAMLPASSAEGPLTSLTRNGQPVARSARTVKGVEYLVFDAVAGDYEAGYASDAAAPAISALVATADGDGRATVSWRTDEPASSTVDYGETTSLGTQVTDGARVTEHEIELTGLKPDTTYHYRVTSVDAAGNTASAPPAGQGPAGFQTPPGGFVDDRTSDFAAGTDGGTHAGQTLAGADGEVQLEPEVGEEFEGAALPSGWDTRSWGAGGDISVSGGALTADGAAAYTTPYFEGPRVLEFVATFRPVNDQGVGFGGDLSDFPMAVFTTGNSGSAFQVYAESGAGVSGHVVTPLPSVSLNQPHRFRIEWKESSVAFYVDGALVATHANSIPSLMRPVASDYGLFGAAVRVEWLRQGGYPGTGTFTSRVMDAGPDAADWQELTAQSTLPAGTQLAFDTRSGPTPQPDGGWSAWEPVGAGGSIASPDARYVQYRARMASATGLATPTLRRVEMSFGPGQTDTTAPNVAITAPAGGSRVAGAVTLSASATDDVGVESVRFQVDGEDLGAADTSSPYSVSWDTAEVPDGTHAITAVARDAAGNTRTSAAVAVTVDNTAPAVSITAPASGSAVSGTTTLTASASDGAGVQSVQFQVDGQNVGAADTSSPYSVSWNTAGASNGTHTITAVARDALGNSRTSAAVTVTVDNVAPAVSVTGPAAGAIVSGTTAVTANASDNVAVQSVQFRVDGQNAGAADTAAPYSLSWNTVPLTDGTHTLSAVALDSAGNTRTSSNVTVTVDNDGLIAAYGFEETSGSTVTDVVRDHDGTISGASRTTAGRFGRALTFDGSNDRVTVPHASDLNLTAGLTVEAWVRPSSLSSWRAVAVKERSSSLSYALYANSSGSRPTARLFTTSDLATSGTAQLGLSTWSHLTMTWSGSTLRLYVNGTQVSSRTVSGSLATGTSPLRIGGRIGASEWFNGRIDELRVYRRALSATEITADMNRAVP
jgi:hypothetical protein